MLRRYDPSSGESVLMSRLLPSPSTIKGITFDASNSDRILASGEGGILESLDNGANWENLLGDVDFRFYFRVVLDPEDGRTLYTAGWDKIFEEPQPLIVEVSRNDGATWEKHNLDNPELFGGVWSLMAVSEDARTVIYAGLYKGGVMKILLP